MTTLKDIYEWGANPLNLLVSFLFLSLWSISFCSKGWSEISAVLFSLFSVGISQVCAYFLCSKFFQQESSAREVS